MRYREVKGLPKTVRSTVLRVWLSYLGCWVNTAIRSHVHWHSYSSGDFQSPGAIRKFCLNESACDTFVPLGNFPSTENTAPRSSQRVRYRIVDWDGKHLPRNTCLWDDEELASFLTLKCLRDHEPTLNSPPEGTGLPWRHHPRRGNWSLRTSTLTYPTNPVLMKKQTNKPEK